MEDSEDKEFKVPRTDKVRGYRRYHSQRNLKFEELAKQQILGDKIVLEQGSCSDEERASRGLSQTSKPPKIK